MGLNTEYEKEGYDIIGAAFEVRKFAGRYMRESYYQQALAWELRNKGYTVDLERPIAVSYKGIIIGDAYHADIILNDRIIIETKAVKFMNSNEPRQLFSYLKLSGLYLGYLINFGSETFKIGNLMRENTPYYCGIYRMVNG